MFFINCYPSNSSYTPTDVDAIRIGTYTLSSCGVVLNLILLLVIGCQRLKGYFPIALLLTSDLVLCVYFFMHIVIVDTDIINVEIMKKIVWIIVGSSNYWLVCMLFNRCAVLMLTNCTKRTWHRRVTKILCSKHFELVQFSLCIIASGIMAYKIRKRGCRFHMVFYGIPMLCIVFLCLIAVILYCLIVRPSKDGENEPSQMTHKPEVKLHRSNCWFLCMWNRCSKTPDPNSGTTYESSLIHTSNNTSASVQIDAGGNKVDLQKRSPESRFHHKCKAVFKMVKTISAIGISCLVFDALQITLEKKKVMYYEIMKNIFTIFKTMSNAVILCFFDHRFRKGAVKQFCQMKKRLTRPCCKDTSKQKCRHFGVGEFYCVREHPRRSRLYNRRYKAYSSCGQPQEMPAYYVNAKQFFNALPYQHPDQARFLNHIRPAKPIITKRTNESSGIVTRLKNVFSREQNNVNSALSWKQGMIALHPPEKYSNSLTINSSTESHPSSSYGSARSDSQVAKLLTRDNNNPIMIFCVTNMQPHLMKNPVVCNNCSCHCR